MDTKLCRVGYALNPKKLRKSSISTKKESKQKGEWSGGGLADILEANPDSSGIHFLPWDYELPLGKQPDFDVIIHKLTEDIEKKDPSEKLIALESYLKSHPDTVIVDPIESVRKVVSRVRTCEYMNLIRQKLGADCPFAQPKHVTIENDTSDAELLQQLRHRGISMPVICKTIEACGTPDSHTMMVIVNEADVHLIMRPCIVQQYYDHDENFFKVYVMDEDVMVFRRASLPNLNRMIATKPVVGSGLRSVVFDSQKNYPGIDDFLCDADSSVDIATDRSGYAAGPNEEVKREAHDILEELYLQTSRVSGSSLQSDPSLPSDVGVFDLLLPGFDDGETSRDDSAATSGSKRKLPWMGNHASLSNSWKVAERLNSRYASAPVDKAHDLSYWRTSLTADLATAESKTSSCFVYDKAAVTSSTKGEVALSAAQREQFERAAKVLRDEFGLSLFGFDVIIPVAEQAAEQGMGRMMVIDINYFPSYKEVRDFPQRLQAFLRRKTEQARSKMTSHRQSLSHS